MTDLKQLKTYTTQETINALRIRAAEHQMTMSKYIEYLILQDISTSGTTKTQNITLANKLKGRKAYFFSLLTTPEVGIGPFLHPVILDFLCVRS